MNTLKKLKVVLGRKSVYKFLILITAIFFGAILEIVSIYITYPFMQLVMNPGIIHEQPILKKVYDGFNFASEQQFFIFISLFLCMFFLISIVYQIYIVNKQYRLVGKEQFELTSVLVNWFMNKPHEHWYHNNRSDVTRLVSSEINNLFNKVIVKLLVFFNEMLMVFIIFFVLLFIDMKMTLSIALVLGSIFGAVFIYFHARSKRLFESQRTIRKETIDYLNNLVQGTKEIRTTGSETYFISNYRELVKKLTDNIKTFRVSQQIPGVFIQSIKMYSMLIVILFSLLSNRDLSTILPLLLLYSMALFKLIPSINRMFKALFEVKIFKPSLDAVYKVINDNQIERKNKGNTVDSSVSKILRIKERLLLDRLSYRDEKTGLFIINELSIEIMRGKSTAIVGPPKSGKSLIGEILSGLIWPHSGRVFIDLGEIKDQTMMKGLEVGYMPQQPLILHASLRSNITFGCDPSSIDESKLMDVVAATGLQDFIQVLPGGLDTVIDESIELSASHRKQIGIARVLYSQPELYIFDEAFSLLDNNLANRLYDLLAGKTVLFLTTRRRSVDHCDFIYEIQNGEIKKDVSNVK